MAGGAVRGARLGEVLFPMAPVWSRAQAVRDRWVVAAAALVSLIGLVLWRGSPSPADYLWAEDGTVFLHDAATLPFPATVLRPLAGYAHVVPRLLVALVVHAPVAQWALLVAVSAAVVRVGVAVLVWHATAGAVPSRWMRSAIAVVVVTLPAGSLEVLDSIANLHWFLLVGAVVAALWTPRGLGGRVVQTLALALAVLSDPVAIGILAVLLCRAVLLRKRSEWLLLGLVSAAAVVQLWVVHESGGRAVQDGNTVWQTGQVYAVRVAFLSVLGPSLGQRFHSVPVVAAVLAALAVVLAVGVLRRSRAQAFVWFAMLASLGLFAAAMLYLPRDPLFVPNFAFTSGYALRYMVAPMILLLGAFVASGVSVLALPRGRMIVLPIAAAVVAVYLAGVVVTFREPAATTVPAFRDQVAAAQAGCRAGMPDGRITVEPFAWELRLPCSVLVRGG